MTKWLYYLLCVILLVNLVPAAQFLIRVPSAAMSNDLVADKTIIGTPFGSPIGGVYESMVAGGRILKRGGDPYKTDTLLQDDARGAGFLYPPLVGAIGVVFSHFTPFQGYILWLLLLLAGVVCFLFLAMQRIPKKYHLLSAFLIILSTPLVRQLLWGHSILIVLLCVYMTYHWADKNELMTGLALGISSALFFYTGIFFVYLFLKKKWTALIAGCITLLVTFMPFLFNAPARKGFLTFLSIARTLPLQQYSDAAFFSLHRVFYTIHPNLHGAFLGIVALVFALVLLQYFRHWNQLSKYSLDLFFVFSILTVLMIDTWLSEHHLPLLLAAYVIMIGKPGWKVILPILYILTDMFMWLFGISIGGFNAWTILRFIGVFAFYIYLLVLLKRGWKGAKSPKTFINPSKSQLV